MSKFQKKVSTKETTDIILINHIKGFVPQYENADDSNSELTGYRTIFATDVAYLGSTKRNERSKYVATTTEFVDAVLEHLGLTISDFAYYGKNGDTLLRKDDKDRTIRIPQDALNGLTVTLGGREFTFSDGKQKDEEGNLKPQVQICVYQDIKCGTAYRAYESDDRGRWETADNMLNRKGCYVARKGDSIEPLFISLQAKFTDGMTGGKPNADMTEEQAVEQFMKDEIKHDNPVNGKGWKYLKGQLADFTEVLEHELSQDCYPYGLEKLMERVDKNGNTILDSETIEAMQAVFDKYANASNDEELENVDLEDEVLDTTNDDDLD